jgi:hypothetical protein
MSPENRIRCIDAAARFHQSNFRFGKMAVPRARAAIPNAAQHTFRIARPLASAGF